MPTTDNQMQTGEESVSLQNKEELQSLNAVVICTFEQMCV